MNEGCIPGIINLSQREKSQMIGIPDEHRLMQRVHPVHLALKEVLESAQNSAVKKVNLFNYGHFMYTPYEIIHGINYSSGDTGGSHRMYSDRTLFSTERNRNNGSSH